MVYHIVIFSLGALDSSSFLGRLGVYGVSIFFILSGLSMAIVYNQFIINLNTSINFFVRRIFRIWPLLWVVTFFVILSGNFSWKLILVNFTTLFGFLKPEAYIATGAWSIGNEMVYYALTPLIIYLYNFNKWIGNSVFFISLTIGLLFAFTLLNENVPIGDQWEVYVNPFNNLFLYVMGIAIYYNLREIEVHQKLNVLLLIFAIILFSWIPFHGNLISIVTGSGRIFFVIVSFVIVFCFYKLKIQVPNIIKVSFEKLGIATYGVYLIHPIIYFYLSFITDKFIYLMVFVPLLTVSLSILSYKYFEVKFINFGKTIARVNFF